MAKKDEVKKDEKEIKETQFGAEKKPKFGDKNAKLKFGGV